MNTITQIVVERLNSTSWRNDLTNQVDPASPYGNLPQTRIAAVYWSQFHKRGIPSYFDHCYDGDGTLMFYCPRWVLIERSIYARVVRRELQRRYGLRMRNFLTTYASDGISRARAAVVAPQSLVQMIRTCNLSPSESITRHVMVLGANVEADGRDYVQKLYRPFGFNNCIGLEFECYGAITRTKLSESLPYWTRVVSDGSIRAEIEGAEGHEVRVLLDRTKAEPRLFKLCAKLQELGLRVNRSCGLHVHLDTRSVTSFADVVKIGKNMDAWLYALRELLPPSRRENNYCRFGVRQNDRYSAVNVASWSKHRTIEVRCHSATLDYTKVLAWVRLCELVRAMVKRPKVASCIATLEQLPLATHDLAYWRARHRELNPSLYANSATDTTTDSE